MTLTAGTKISHYRIVSTLGAGGMGEVYKAEDTILDRPVALKILPAELVDNEDRVRRFVQEAKSASALNHPHIVTIYEIGKVELENRSDGHEGGNGSNGSKPTELFHYIAMEFIDGDTLRDKIHRDRTDLKKLLEYFAQVADGLAKAHASGIVHRDLKPENVMITQDGYAKILDFGLAKLLEPQKPPSDDILEAETMMMGRTQPGIVMGTIGYMSPEQVQGKVVDQRSDIFSFGCILYEATTGHKPFHGESVIDSLHKIVYSQAPPIREFNPETPAELQRIIRKCLSKDPDERYQSIKDANIDLRELVREYDSQPSVSAFYSAMTSSYPHMSSNPDITMVSGSMPTPRLAADRKPWLWIAMGACGALIIGLIVILIGQFFSGDSRGTESGAPFNDVRITRLTNTGKSYQAVISPDGKYIAHIMSDGGKQSLWVRHIATARNVEIVPPLDSIYRGISFSRDSNFVYYAVSEKNKPVAVLYQIGALGGTPKRIVEDVDSAISISPDNSQFVFLRGIPNQRRSELVIANMDGSGERTLAVRRLPDFFQSPAWSPDGRVVACSAGTGANGAYMTVTAVNVADGTEKPVTSETWLEVGRVSWVKDGSALVMTATDQASRVSQVWRVAYPGGETRRITNDLNQYVSASLTEDSNTLTVVEQDSLANLWTAPGGDANRARQITSGAGKYGRVSWTPDGKLLYNVGEGGDLNIWRMDADGGNQKQLTVDSGVNFHATASPDGRYIAFVSTRGGDPNDNNIWRMDADGRNPKQLTRSDGDVSPAFSPDGKWVVYHSYTSGRSHLWRVPVDGGEPMQLTDTTAYLPAVSPDGKYIACGYWDEQITSQVAVAIIPFDGGQPVKTFNIQIGLMRWSADGSGLMFLDNQDGVSNIWLQPIAGGEPKQLTNFKADRIFSFDWSRDRQLACSRGIVTSDVVILSNVK